MNKIVIDARGYSTTTGRYARKLIEYLEELEQGSGDRKYVVLLFSHELKDYKPKNPQFTKLPADFPHYGLAEQFGFKKFLEGLNADLVHFTMPQQPIFYRGKSVTTIHDLTLLKVYPGNRNKLLYKLKQAAGGFIFRRIANKSEHIITPSQFTKEDYLRFLQQPKLQSKITVTHEGADVNTDKPLPYKPLFDKKYIMYVGQQSNYKNLRRLMEAHQQLLSTHPSLQLVFVGKPGVNGEKDKLWAKKQGFKNIVYTGFVTDPQLAWLFQNCQAYVFPSLMEGFGLPGLEAMGYGAPVVSSDATSLPEVHGDASVYFDPTNINDMAEKIDQVISDDKLRADLVKKGYERLKQFSWKRMAQQTLDIYNKFL